MAHRSISLLRLGAIPLGAALMLAGQPAAAQQKVLRVVPQADVKVLDTHVVSVQITKIHALLIYDTLFAWDFKLQAKPQMIGDYTVSPDKLKYTLTLRPGQKWHDGQPVTTKDAIASLTRWMKRDVMGQNLGKSIASMEATDEKTFVITMKQPYGFVEFTLGSGGGQMPAIYPERVAMTDPFQPITETIGSGPFKFNKAEWRPGDKVIYDKNTDYVPRSEPPDGLAGGKVVKVDRVEFDVIPDSGTVAAALAKGEVDLWDSPANDMLGTLGKNPDIVVKTLPPFGNFGFLRVNSLHPPFNNVKARQALAVAFDQRDFMRTAYGDEKWWKVCYAYFVCDAPWATEVGSEPYRHADLAKAKQLMAEAGYKGEKLVMITTNEIPQIGQMAQVAVGRLKEMGVDVDMQVNDWGSVVTRMTKKELPAQGGWNMFTSWGTGTTFHHPLTNIGSNMSCDQSNWVGWPCDEETEKLRTAFVAASDDAGRKAAMEVLHKRLMEMQPYTLLGQFEPPFAWRKNVDGVLRGAVLVFWNITKS